MIEPTDKQLSDLWLSIDDYTGDTTVGDRMRRAWKFVAQAVAKAERERIKSALRNSINTFPDSEPTELQRGWNNGVSFAISWIQNISDEVKK